MNNSQTKTKTVHQTTPTATVFRITRNSGIIFILIGLFGPFLHLFADSGKEGPLHWAWEISFFDSLGWAMLPFFLGLGFFFVSMMILEKVPKLVIKFTAISLIAIGSFYFAYTFISIRDFSNAGYYSLLSGIAVVSALMIWLTIRLYKTQEVRLLKIIASISRFMVIDAKEYIKPGKENETEYVKGYRKALKDGMK